MAILAILLVTAGEGLMSLLVASVARKVTRPMCALTTSLVHQQILLQLFPKRQRLILSSRCLLRDALRASAMVTAWKAIGPSRTRSASPSLSTAGISATGLPEHFSCAKTQRLLKVRKFRKLTYASILKKPKKLLAKKAVNFVSSGVMNCFSALSVAENTPPSVRFTAETNDGPNSPKQSNDEELVSFPLNADDEAWMDYPSDLADLDS